MASVNGATWAMRIGGPLSIVGSRLVGMRPWLTVSGSPRLIVLVFEDGHDLDHAVDATLRERSGGLHEGFVVRHPGLRLRELFARRTQTDDPGDDHVVDRTKRSNRILLRQSSHQLARRSTSLNAHLQPERQPMAINAISRRQFHGGPSSRRILTSMRKLRAEN